jgi:hypothetical protein
MSHRPVPVSCPFFCSGSRLLLSSRLLFTASLHGFSRLPSSRLSSFQHLHGTSPFQKKVASSANSAVATFFLPFFYAQVQAGPRAGPEAGPEAGPRKKPASRPKSRAQGEACTGLAIVMASMAPTLWWRYFYSACHLTKAQVAAAEYVAAGPRAQNIQRQWPKQGPRPCPRPCARPPR